MAVHRPVWNASSIAMWEWEGGGFSGLCVACGLRARTPLLEGWPASPSDSPLPCFVSSSVTISFIQVRAGSWLWTPVFPVCLPSLHTHKCTVRQMPCCHLSGLKKCCCDRAGFSLFESKGWQQNIRCNPSSKNVAAYSRDDTYSIQELKIISKMG